MPFAVACVVGELKRHLRDTGWRLHVPRPRKEQVLRLYQTADELHQTLGRAPTTRELAGHLGLTEEELLETWAAAQSQIGLSLDRPAGDDTEVSMGDLVAAAGPREEPEDLLVLADLLAELPDSATPRCTCRGCSAGPWPTCVLSWWSPDRVRASRYVAGFDSSGAMLRALARFLHGQDFPALGNPRMLAPLLVAANLLPTRLRERVYAASGGLTAVPAKRLGRRFAEDVAAW